MRQKERATYFLALARSARLNGNMAQAVWALSFAVDNTRLLTLCARQRSSVRDIF